jgi:hypothetical protein
MRRAFIAIAVLAWFLASPTTGSEVPAKTNPDAEQQIAELMKELPSSSSLHQRLVHGGRGDGEHHSWMDEMQRERIRRILAVVRISFNHRGRPKKLAIERVEFFTDYDGQKQLTDVERLAKIRATGLEKEITNLAIERSNHGMWVDVPHPRPQSFVGAAWVEFFDNEWLPVFQVPMYCAGLPCLADQPSTN